MMESCIVQNVYSRFSLWSQGIDRVFCPTSEKKSGSSFVEKQNTVILKARKARFPVAISNTK